MWERGVYIYGTPEVSNNFPSVTMDDYKHMKVKNNSTNPASNE